MTLRIGTECIYCAHHVKIIAITKDGIKYQMLDMPYQPVYTAPLKDFEKVTPVPVLSKEAE